MFYFELARDERDLAVIRRVSNAQDLGQFLDELGIEGSIFVVKPSWHNAETFTSVATLDALLSNLRGRVKVIDGYNLNRNEQNLKLNVRPSNVKSKWRWLKEQENWFLEFSGINQVLTKNKVDYINITEEIWLAQLLEPEEVKDRVDAKYGVLVSEEMYSFVPKKVFMLRDSPLISLNTVDKIEGRTVFSTENLFSLIPNPARYERYTGKSKARLTQSIIDINKIYRSIFSPCFWINEIKESKILVGSRNSAESDAVAAAILGIAPENIEYQNHAETVFGEYDKKILDEIKNY